MNESQVEFNLENVEKTLHQFYHDAQSQAQANQYLMLAQVSPEAWTFAWQLLHPSKPQEAQFFGASTLQVKISRHWDEIPSDQYDILRSKLLEAIIAYVSGPKIVLTRLCIALSSYIIHTITDFWPTAINDIMSTLQPQNIPVANPQQVMHVLLELLTVLYEEFQTVFMPITKVGLVRNALQSSFQPVMTLIEEILSQPASDSLNDLCNIALKCYSSWDELSSSSSLQYESLLLLAFNAIYNEQLCHTALEALSNILTHPNANKYPNMILKMVEQLVKLDSLIKKAIQDDDMDTCCSIYALIINVAENHSKFLLDTILQKPEKRDVILKLISLILQCSGTAGQYPVDEICSEEAFSYWYTLQDDIVGADPQKFEAFLLIFHPLFHSLVDTYLVKVRYPPDDVYRQWTTDEQEAFRCYRQDIGDSFMYCYSILRQAMLANLMAHLSIATTTAISDPSQWQYLEACLFAFHSVAESVDLEEHCYIPQFMAHLPSIPLQHFRVISASMDAVGAYAEWINSHADVLGCVIPLLLMGLQNADVAPSASMALKDITRDCHSSMQSFAEQILLTSQEALKGTILKSRERVRLMSTIGQVLSIMPFVYTMSYLNTLLTPIIHQLQHFAVQESTANSRAAIVLHLHMLSMLFATLDTKRKEVEKDSAEENQACKSDAQQCSQAPQPILLVLQKVMPVFNLLGNNWATNEQITEALCETLKKAISTLLDDCKSLVSDILHLILHLYKQCPHSTVLDMAKQMLLLFSTDEDQRSQLSSFFAEICNHTLQLSHTDIRENTVVIEMFLQLLAQVVKKVPVFLKSESINLQVLFQCGVAALGLPEKQTVKAASSFISEFVIRSREVPNMSNIVNNQGEILVGQVLRVIGGESPRAVVEHMPDILMALNKKYFDNFCRWMSTFIQQQGFPSPRVSQEQKEHFARLVLKERTNKRKLKETVNEFSLICRGLIGTEYAAQTVTLS